MRLRHKAVQAAAAFLLFAVTQAPAATINWGSPVLSTTADSKGEALDSSYSVELGAFANGFVPTAENTEDWAANWRTFSVASFDPELGYFTGTADLLVGGGSSDPLADTGINFSDMEVYVWVFNSTTMEPESEWFLGRSDSWVMPTAPTECCDNGLPTQWSTTDFTTSDTPVYGAQGPVFGGGVSDNPGVYTIQTHTVPEASTLVLAAFGMMFCLRRRRPIS
ncbi:PEP-CTERM sorting domain-containing protein [Luteolibacter sp. GHJ8]|uniref:PEP-CTERM sorting domain-containing protein n=1 Tax=Luteolibacter rhizosphaerae TaxID=2989719 RepID=A0ABT3G570_9BACT|nr:PEP-CTERM sorting domain-containing protein [Luteolibacter rhizosphaerae]MCW1914641.1 PEP-CTERM sorting domain-containing protein [Luteolibacter rhizosphaerae]